MGQLIFDKGANTIQWERNNLFNKWCWLVTTGWLHTKNSSCFLCIISLTFPVLHWLLWASQGPKVLSMRFLALVIYAPHPAGKASHLTSSSISCTSYNPLSPQSNGFYLSARPWNSNKPITNKPMTSCGNQGSPHPLDTMKSDFHSLYLFLLF